MIEELDIKLPKTKIKAAYKSPRKLIIFSKPKVGKTSAVAELESSLLLDFENGSDFLDATKVKINNLDDLKKIGTEIIKQNKPYKYGIVDTVTKLEDMVKPLALKLYNDTPLGKTFKGDVTTLPNGAGYLYIREAFFSVLSYIETLFDRVIYLGHLKAKFFEKNGKEVSAAELDLTGKMKSILSADVDAIGLLYREGNQTILSFETTDDIICGARPDHLKNTKIILSEYNMGKLEVNWSKVFID